MLLGLITRECSRNINRAITEEWCKLALHNKEINYVEKIRELDLATTDKKYNAASKIYSRIAVHLLETKKLEIGKGYYEIETQNEQEVVEWVDQLKGIGIVDWVAQKLDATVELIRLRYSTGYRKIWFLFKLNSEDEGFEGGITTVRYEKERLREEWKTEEIRKNKVDQS